MTAQQIQTIRERFAGKDMALARKPRGNVITGTAAGNLDITYDAATKTYRIVDFIHGTLLHEGAAKTTKAYIAAQYIVVA